MEKSVKWILSWECAGNKHIREYDNDKLASICWDECMSIPANHNVTLKQVETTILSTTVKSEPRHRIFAVVTYKDTAENSKRRCFELSHSDNISFFSEFLDDRDVFSVNFYISTSVPSFIRRMGYTKMK